MVSQSTCYILMAITAALVGGYLIAVLEECWTLPLLILTFTSVFYFGYMSKICPSHLSFGDAKRQDDLFL